MKDDSVKIQLTQKKILLKVAARMSLQISLLHKKNGGNLLMVLWIVI